MPSLPEISPLFAPRQRIVVFPGDCLEFLRSIPDATFQLVVTSPPYNLGKEYERRVQLDDYVEQQREVIRECVRTLKPSGSICWEVGNYVDDGAIVSLDVLLFPVFIELGLRCRDIRGISWLTAKRKREETRFESEHDGGMG